MSRGLTFTAEAWLYLGAWIEWRGNDLREYDNLQAACDDFNETFFDFKTPLTPRRLRYACKVFNTPYNKVSNVQTK